MIAACDIAIVGAGMAGASLAAALVPHARVLLLEAEDRPGYHATGRSAAFWSQTYGGPAIHPLTAASGPALRDGGFLSPRGALTIGREQDRPRIARFVETFARRGLDMALLERPALLAHVPGLRDDWTIGAWEPTCSDIDVAALHAHYLSTARRGGAELRLRARLVEAKRESGRWHVSLADGTALTCEVLVDAAGAWADDVAARAGVRPLEIRPLRRTVVQLRVAPPVVGTLPLTLGIDEDFYFKPESGRIWLSPHDETPSRACDAAPEEIDIATAVDRLERVVDWQVAAVERKWAGLRSFAPDRKPVYGFDTRQPGFFWCAGQGGFGIQTAPAGAALCAGLLRGDRASPAGDVDPASFSPARFG